MKRNRLWQLILISCLLQTTLHINAKNTATDEKPFEINATNSELTITFKDRIKRVDTDDIPIEINPKLNCKWVWLSDQILRCVLDEFAPNDDPANKQLSNTTYTVTSKKGFVTTDGQDLLPSVITFISSRPTALYLKTHKWLSPNEPIFSVQFNTKIDHAAISADNFKLLHDGKKYKLEMLSRYSYSHFFKYSYKHLKDKIVLLKPIDSLPFDTHFQLHIDDKVKPLKGDVNSASEVTALTLNTYPEKNNITDTYCARNIWRDIEKLESCHLDDYLFFSTAHELDFKVTPACSKLFTRMMLRQNRNRDYSIKFNYIYSNRKDLESCFKGIYDQFGQINDFSSVLEFPFIPESYPRVNLSSKQTQYITAEETAFLKVSSINTESFYVHINQVNDQKVDIGFTQQVNDSKKTQYSFTDVDLPNESDVHTVSGSIKMTQDSSESLSFSVLKSPFRISLKQNPRFMTLLIHDASSIRPIGLTAFKVKTPQNEYQGKTDELGFAQVELLPSDFVDNKPIDDIDLTIKHENKVYYLSDISMFSKVTYAKNSEPDTTTMREGELLVWGITDKPLYRAGEHVKYKLYVREKQGDHFIIPENFSTIQSYLNANINEIGFENYCSDYSECHSFYKKEINDLDQFGSIQGEFKIPESARNATYDFVFSYPINEDNNTAQDNWYRPDEKLIYSEFSFQVTDFQTSPYLLSIETDVNEISPDTPFNLNATAQYYSGGPVINQQAQITMEVINKRFTDDYPEFNEYSFTECQNCYGESDFLDSLAFDNNGELLTEYSIEENDVDYGYVRLNSGIKPENGSWAYSQDLHVPYHQNEFYVGIKSDQYLYRTGEEINLESILVKFNGELQDDPVFNYSVARYNSYSSRSDFKPLDCSDGAQCITQINQSGSYEIKAQATVNEETFEHIHHLYIYSPYFANDGKGVKKPIILTNKRQYKIGDIAEIKINTPYPNVKYAIYLERNKVLDRWVKSTETGTIEISIPITEQHIPGFSVTTDLLGINDRPVDLKLNDYREVSNHVKVEHEEKARFFSISTNQQNYLPGTLVDLNLVSTFDTDAEFTVLVVDEAVVSLIDDNVYYELNESALTWALKVWQTMTQYTMLPKNLTVNENGPGLTDAEVEMSEEGGRITVTGSRISSSDMAAIDAASTSLKSGFVEKLLSSDYISSVDEVTVKDLTINIKQLRTLFKESAYFESGWVVKPGQADTKQIKLPDNIGAWRIVVVGADQVGKINTQSISVKANKELEVFTALPEQLAVNDQFIGQVNVVNKTAESAVIEIAAKAEGNNQETFAVQREIDSPLQNQQYNQPLSVKVGDTESISIIAIAQSDDNQDGLIKNIPIRQLSITSGQQMTGQFNTSSHQFSFDVADRVIGQHGELDLHISPSIANQLNPTFNYMQKYPYTCWEQQLAKATSAAVNMSINQHAYSKEKLIELQHPIQSTIDRAFDFQASNGGMTFFGANKENVSPFLTFHTYFAIKEFSNMGYQVPDAVVSHIKEFASNYLEDYRRYQDNKRYDFITEQSQYTPELFFMALRIASKSEVAKKTFNELISDANNLSVTSLNQLILLAGDDSKQQFLQQLSKKYYNNGQWRSLVSDPTSVWYLMESSLKAQCETVSALIDTNQGEGPNDEIYRHLLNVLGQTNTTGEIGTTIENTVCLLAFKKFIDRYENKTNDLAFEVQVNDIKYKTSKRLTEQVTITKPIDISISNSAETQLYYSAELTFQQDANYEVPIGEGLEINRTYQVFNEGSWQNIQHNQFKVGDWIKTEIAVVNPIQRSFIAVSSPNPGAWVPVNPVLNTSVPVGLINSMDNYADDSYFYERQLKPATSYFYADLLPAGVHNIVYYSQIKVAGNFSALPATVEAMYNREVRAQTALKKIDVRVD